MIQRSYELFYLGDVSMKMMKLNLSFLVLFVIIVQITKANVPDSVFGVPEILKGNVAFWKKIYSEIPLSGGLIHDRDYPFVIYEQLMNNPSQKLIKQKKDTISASLKKVATEPESTWTTFDRSVRDLFLQFAPKEALADAHTRVRFQLGQQDRFKSGLERSGLYLDTIKHIFKQYGIPERLAYLPHVESSFNTEAYSKVGAAGLWQFMRGTAKYYGMTISYTIDERRDPIKATVAAAKYLSSSYQALKSWPLAITSYNHGIYGMKRAVQQTGSNDLAIIIQKYNSPSFKFASSNFYSCFLAASELAMNHNKHFTGLQIKPKVNQFDITLDNYIGPNVLSEYLKVPIDQLAALNPAIRQSIFEQNKKLPKGFVIHVPMNTSLNEIQLAMKSIPDSLISTEPERATYYKVVRGDNLNKIAEKLGVSVKELALENNLSRKNQLKADQVLRVPSRAIASQPVKTDTVVASLVVASNMTPTNNVFFRDTSVAPVAEIAKVEKPSDYMESTIPPTPTIADTVISTPPVVEKKPDPVPPKKTNLLSALLAPKKKQPTTKPSVNDSIKEIASAPAVSETPSPKNNKTLSTQTSFDISIYDLEAVVASTGTTAEIRVSLDETIGHYADWLSVPTSRIRKLNEMGRNSDIRLNKKLIIPIVNTDALERFAAARLEYHMAIEEDFYSQYKVTEIKQRELAKGDNLWSICNQDPDNQIPLWLFKKVNAQLDLSKLLPGTVVSVPVIVEKSEQEMKPKKVKKVSNVQNVNYKLASNSVIPLP